MIPLTPEQREQAIKIHQRKAKKEPLTEAEETLVAQWYAEMEAEETTRLAPAMERMEQMIVKARERREKLEQWLAREKAAYAQLVQVIEEIKAIDSEHKSLMESNP
jgi:hypothetical protein